MCPPVTPENIQTIFKIAAAAILDFQKCEILTVGRRYVDIMHHSAKFHQNRLNGCGHSTAFQMAAVRHLGFVGRVLGPPTMNTWWSLSLCKIWLESMP